VTEGYQYQQTSPARSPSGPTYTQLSAGNGNRQQPQPGAYQAGPPPPPPNAPGMWDWQQAGGHPHPPHPTAHPHHPHAHPGGPAGAGQPQGQEFSDMLQMLDHSAPTTFEDLNINMFSTPFE